jgi:hypothetical protein
LLLALWTILSLGWAAAVAIHVYDRANQEADVARDVERDLDTSACTGADCAAQSSTHVGLRERWSDVAMTYLRFGYLPILEWSVGPPAALLVVGVGMIIVHRRRRIDDGRR